MTQVRRHIFTFIILGGLASPQAAHAISPWLSTPRIAKLYAFTAVGLLIAYYRTERDIQRHTKPVTPRVEQFIRTELQKMQVPHWQTVRILAHPRTSMATIHTLCLEQDLVDQITQTGDKQYLARAVIHHEAGHLKHKHVLTKAVLNPFLSTLAAYSAFKFLPYIYPRKGSYHGFLALELGLDLGLYFYIISPFFSRICEWQADEFIADDPHILAGGIRYFTQELRDRSAYFNRIVRNVPIRGRLLHWYHTCELISTHPSLEKRIKRLQ